jgi:radical SAM superfamily enzyme YgiQ (UPF0313 family)
MFRKLLAINIKLIRVSYKQKRYQEKETVIILNPKYGYASGRMPHITKPTQFNIPVALKYLYSATKNLGYNAEVLDANASPGYLDLIRKKNPIKLLITSTTPNFGNVMNDVRTLRSKGFDNKIYIGGSHTSLNLSERNFLLPQLDNTTYVNTTSRATNFDWIPDVFPDKRPVDVLGPDVTSRLLENNIFPLYDPEENWMTGTYRGDHVSEEFMRIKIRATLLTSVGCTNSCGFCSNPLYEKGFKAISKVESNLIRLKELGIQSVSISDMYFFMKQAHSSNVLDLLKKHEFKFSMQTCLSSLNDQNLDKAATSGLETFLIGMENPFLSCGDLGKKVDSSRVQWVLDRARDKNLWIMLSYITGLPSVKIQDDIKLINYIQDIMKRYKLHHTQVQANIYMPYRPSRLTRPFAGQFDEDHSVEYILNGQEFYKFWGVMPIAFETGTDLFNRLRINDLIYQKIYPDFLNSYQELRKEFMDLVGSEYPSLMQHINR